MAGGGVGRGKQREKKEGEGGKSKLSKSTSSNKNRLPTESVSELSSQAAKVGQLGYPKKKGRASWALGIAARVPVQPLHCARQTHPWESERRLLQQQQQKG